MELKNLIDQEEILAQQLLEKVAEMVKISNEINSATKYDVKFRPLYLYNSRNARIFWGIKNSIESRKRLSNILSIINESIEREREEAARNAKKVQAKNNKSGRTK